MAAILCSLHPRTGRKKAVAPPSSISFSGIFLPGHPRRAAAVSGPGFPDYFSREHHGSAKRPGGSCQEPAARMLVPAARWTGSLRTIKLTCISTGPGGNHDSMASATGQVFRQYIIEQRSAFKSQSRDRRKQARSWRTVSNINRRPVIQPAQDALRASSARSQQIARRVFLHQELACFSLSSFKILQHCREGLRSVCQIPAAATARGTGTNYQVLRPSSSISGCGAWNEWRSRRVLDDGGVGQAGARRPRVSRSQPDGWFIRLFGGRRRQQKPGHRA